MVKRLKCKISYFVDKYGRKMKGSTYSTTKGWVKGIKECSKKQRKKILNKIEDKYFDYPGARRK